MTFSCQLCSKEFCVKNSLRRHVNKKHPSQLPPKRESVITNKNFKCHICSRQFLLKGSLSRHLKKNHGEKLPTKAKIKNFSCGSCGKQFVLKSSLSRHLVEKHQHVRQSAFTTETTGEGLYCNICNAVFNRKNNLRNHLKKHAANKVTNKFSCNVCVYNINTMDGLIQHYDDAHQITIKRETLRFNDFESFLLWKENEEVCTYSKYVRLFGMKHSRNGCQRTIYFCHRQGSFKSKEKRQRHLKVQGSNKTVNVCPSRMIVLIETNGQVSVDFIMSHVGHDFDLCRLNLSVSERKLLATRISIGVPVQDIINEARNSTGASLKRYNLLTRRDLCNIEKSFNLTANRATASKSDVVCKTEIVDVKDNAPRKPQSRIDEEFAHLVSETCGRANMSPCGESDSMGASEGDMDMSSTNDDATYRESGLDSGTDDPSILVLNEETFLEAKKRFSTEILQTIEHCVLTPEELALAIENFRSLMPKILAHREQNMVTTDHCTEMASDSV